MLLGKSFKLTMHAENGVDSRRWGSTEMTWETLLQQEPPHKDTKTRKQD